MCIGGQCHLRRLSLMSMRLLAVSAVWAVGVVLRLEDCSGRARLVCLLIGARVSWRRVIGLYICVYIYIYIHSCKTPVIF